jgi:hypothetical protein
VLVDLLPEQIYCKIKKRGDCWVWTGNPDHEGYATVVIKGRRRKLHRVVYALLKGDIPPGMHLHHKCRVKVCVRPSHLQLVTRREHGLIHAADNRKIRCPSDHLYDRVDYRGAQYCSICKAKADKRLYDSRSPDKQEQERRRLREAQRKRRQDPEKRAKMLAATRRWKEAQKLKV